LFVDATELTPMGLPKPPSGPYSFNGYKSWANKFVDT